MNDIRLYIVKTIENHYVFYVEKCSLGFILRDYGSISDSIKYRPYVRLDRIKKEEN